MFEASKRIKNHKSVYFQGRTIIGSKTNLKEAVAKYGNVIDVVKMNGKEYRFGVDFDNITHRNGKTYLYDNGVAIAVK